MNTETTPSLQPIDDFLNVWKTECNRTVPTLYAQYKRDMAKLNAGGKNNLREYMARKHAIENHYGRIVIDHGHAATGNSPKWAAFLDAEANTKKQLLIKRCTDKIGGITGAEWLHVGRTGEIEGYITGPQGRVHIQSILAGGYNIQCLHIRFLIRKVKA